MLSTIGSVASQNSILFPLFPSASSDWKFYGKQLVNSGTEQSASWAIDSSSIRLYAQEGYSPSSYNFINIGTATMIDVTQYKTLKCTFTATRTGQSTYSAPIIVDLRTNTTTRMYGELSPATETDFWDGARNITIDISSVVGSYYIFITCCSAMEAGTVNGIFTKIELSKE